MKKTLYLGNILTMEEPLYAQAMLVENGKIIAIGTKEQVLDFVDAETEQVELGDKLLMPAFIDAHSHFSGCANAMVQVPLAEAVTFEEIEERIAQHIKEQNIPAGQFVVAQGYDHNKLKEKAHPTKEVLDRAAPNNPVLMQHQSGHMGVLNTAALEKFGVTMDTQAPAGGMIEKKNGEVTGYMEENAFLTYLKQVPMPSAQDMLDIFDKTQKMYASYGITTVQEGMLVQELAPFYQMLLQQNRLWLDVVGYGDLNKAEFMKEIFHNNIGKYQGHFRLGGYKIFLDGSPQGKTAWMLHPYFNAEDGYRGYPTMTDEQVEQAIRVAVQDKTQILAHCNGDAAAEQYVCAAEKVAKENSLLCSLKPVIVHAQLTTANQLERAHKIGMMPSFFIAHILHWGDVHIENFGLERASQISLAGTAQKIGMPFTFHQDAPVIMPDMLETVWCAVQRTTKDGVVLGEDERISPLEALKAVTLYAAYQYSEEQNKGSLAVGKQADLVILSDDPLKVEPDDIRKIEVLQTIKEGKTIFVKE